MSTADVRWLQRLDNYERALDDLLLPWRIDLQLGHLIDHEGLLDHLERVGQVLWTQQGQPSSS